MYMLEMNKPINWSKTIDDLYKKGRCNKNKAFIKIELKLFLTAKRFFFLICVQNSEVCKNANIPIKTLNSFTNLKKITFNRIDLADRRIKIQYCTVHKNINTTYLISLNLNCVCSWIWSSNEWCDRTSYLNRQYLSVFNRQW